MMARLAPHIASGLRQALLLHPRSLDSPTARPGVVLLAMDLNVVAVSAEAQELLSLIDDDHAGTNLPVAVYTVAAGTQRHPVRDFGAPAVTQHPSDTRAGDWVQLHASRLQSASGDEQIAVVVQLIDARATAPVMLAAYRLTPRELQVAQLVLRGASTRVIVDTLHISEHTVQDHLKAVFDKTGENSRRDLVAHLTAHAGAERAGRDRR